MTKKHVISPREYFKNTKTLIQKTQVLRLIWKSYALTNCARAESTEAETTKTSKLHY